MNLLTDLPAALAHLTLNFLFSPAENQRISGGAPLDAVLARQLVLVFCQDARDAYHARFDLLELERTLYCPSDAFTAWRSAFHF